MGHSGIGAKSFAILFALANTDVLALTLPDLFSHADADFIGQSDPYADVFGEPASDTDTNRRRFKFGIGQGPGQAALQPDGHQPGVGHGPARCQ